MTKSDAVSSLNIHKREEKTRIPSVKSKETKHEAVHSNVCQTITRTVSVIILSSGEFMELLKKIGFPLLS